MQTIEIEKSINVNFEDILKSIQMLDNQSLSKFAQEVNQLVSKRNNNLHNKREIALLKKINNVIPTSIKRRQKQLYQALQENTLTNREHQELILLNNKLEEKAAERIHLMGELASLRGVSIQQLIVEK